MSDRPAYGPGISYIEHPHYGAVAWPTYNIENKHSQDYYFNEIKNLQAAVKLCKQKRVAIQAGGSVGLWAKELARDFETVYTFEPHPDLFPCLVRNVPERNVIKLQAMLGFDNGRLDLAYRNFGGHYALTERGDFPVIQLDSLYLKDVDLIVLDIEGFEPFALRGMDRTISRCRPVIMVEDIGLTTERYGNSFPHALMLLGDLGYVKHSRVGDDDIYVPVERHL